VLVVVPVPVLVPGFMTVLVLVRSFRIGIELGRAAPPFRHLLVLGLGALGLLGCPELLALRTRGLLVGLGALGSRTGCLLVRSGRFVLHVACSVVGLLAELARLGAARLELPGLRLVARDHHEHDQHHHCYGNCRDHCCTHSDPLFAGDMNLTSRTDAEE